MKSRFFGVLLLVLLTVGIFLLTGCPPRQNRPPTVAKVSGPNGDVSENSSTFTWTGSDPDGTIAKYEYRKDEGSWVSNGTSTSYTWSGYSEGEHKFEVRAQDDKGAYSEPVSWGFAYTVEKVTKLRGPSGSVATNSSVFEWQETEFAGQEVEIVKYDFRKDGGNWTENGTNTSHIWTGYSEGEHTFEVRAQYNGGVYSNTISWDFVYLRSENHGGTLYLHARNEPATLNPLWAQETSSTDIISLNHMSLLRTDTGGLLTTAGLASEWWFSDGGKTASFRIRETLQWSDGIPFTIEDVRWTFEDVVFIEENTANGNATYKDSSGNLPTVSVNGDVISFTWTEPNVWCYKAVGMATILPKHILKEAVDEGWIADAWGIQGWNEVVGMGPFIISEFIEGVKITLSRNPYYFEYEPGGARLPYLDNVEFKFSAIDPLLLFEAGEIDVISPNANAWQRIVTQAEERGWVYGQGGPSLGSEFIAFNFNNPDPAKRNWFRNPYFRRAFQYVMDKDAIIAVLLDSLGTAIYGPVSPSSGFFNPEILEAFPYKYSVTRARLELKRGGFDWDEEGNLIDSEGTIVDFDLITSIERQIICGIIVDSAEKLGMEINLLLMDFHTLVNRLLVPDYDAVLTGLTGTVDPGSGWNIWRTDGGMHFFNFTPETRPGVVDSDIYESFDWEIRIHEIFVEQTAETDELKRWELFAEFQMLAAEYQPLVYTITQNFLYAHKKIVHLANPSPSPAAGVIWGIESMWKE
jgi:peptide/nickel transport system substrate-binding protein